MNKLKNIIVNELLFVNYFETDTEFIEFVSRFLLDNKNNLKHPKITVALWIANEQTTVVYQQTNSIMDFCNGINEYYV